MAQKYLPTYLNDHLAGSVTLLEILDHLSSAYAGTEIQQFAVELRAEVTADRQELERVMATLQISHSATRKASAWIASKLSELKLHVDDLRDRGLRLLEAMELVSVGIEGKRLLWISLDAVAEQMPQLRITDYHRLRLRAEDQRSRVEVFRLQAARQALGM